MGNWEDLQVKYMWKTRGENCHLCDTMAGRVYTYDTWISVSILPGFHLHCNCYLKKVSDSTPTSSLDIFGSDPGSILDNHYFLGLNINTKWLPYNRYLTQQVEKAQMESGKSLGETLKMLSQSQKSGEFFSYGNIAWDQFFSWRVFRTVKMYQSIDGTYTRKLTPQADKLKATSPSRNYSYTYLQLKHLGIE